jgi:hypothetical protein
VICPDLYSDVRLRGSSTTSFILIPTTEGDEAIATPALLISTAHGRVGPATLSILMVQRTRLE